MRTIVSFLITAIVLMGCSSNNVENEKIEVEQNQTQTLKENCKLTGTFLTEGHEMRGIKGKIGFLNLTLESKNPQKILWHFWGEEDEISGKFKLEGTHILSGEKTPLLTDSNSQVRLWESPQTFTQPNLGAIKTLPSIIAFPKHGEWKLDVYLNDKQYAELIVVVEKEKSILGK
jgi:hypothetical protein